MFDRFYHRTKMGIPKFYNQWIRKQRLRGVLEKSVPTFVSSLSIDMNGLIHASAQLVYGYGQGDPQTQAARRQAIATMTPAQLETELFNTIGNRLLEILAQVNPNDTLVMAVDGVAPDAKINQQRQRRFRPAPADQPFDSNAITPGTPFMMRLDNFLERWLLANEYALPPKVIYSSHLVPGEGEHKIIQLMREGIIPDLLASNGRKGAHGLYGLDADLIMLALAAPYDNIFLMREDISDVINIEGLKEYIRTKMDFPSAIDDFIVLASFLGNDFLPHMPIFEDLGFAMEFLIYVYQRVGRSLVGFEEVDGVRVKEINWENLAYYLEALASAEADLVERAAKHEEQMVGRGGGRNIFPSRVFRGALVVTGEGEGGVEGTQPSRIFDFETFREAWYQRSLGPRGDPTVARALLGREPYLVTTERIEEMARTYLQGLGWVYSYYTRGVLGPRPIDVSWLYHYHYTPLLVDLAPTLKAMVLANRQVEGYRVIDVEQPFLSPIHQLLSVLPIRSRSLLPLEIAGLASVDSPIADMYPSEFIIDVEGKSAQWQGVVLLPFVDTQRVIGAVNATAMFSPERARQYQAKNHVIVERRAEVQDWLESQRDLEAYVESINRQLGPGRGRGRGGRGRGRLPSPGRGRGIGRGRGRGVGRGGRGRGLPWSDRPRLM